MIPAFGLVSSHTRKTDLVFFVFFVSFVFTHSLKSFRSCCTCSRRRCEP